MYLLQHHVDIYITTHAHTEKSRPNFGRSISCYLLVQHIRKHTQLQLVTNILFVSYIMRLVHVQKVYYGQCNVNKSKRHFDRMLPKENEKYVRLNSVHQQKFYILRLFSSLIPRNGSFGLSHCLCLCIFMSNAFSLSFSPLNSIQNTTPMRVALKPSSIWYSYTTTAIHIFRSFNFFLFVVNTHWWLSKIYINFIVYIWLVCVYSIWKKELQKQQQ